DVAALARDYARRAQDAARARPMPCLERADVVLTDEALSQFFAPAGSIFATNPYLSHAGAQALFQRESYLALGLGICRKRAADGRFVVDEEILGNTFTLISDATVPMATGSSVFSRTDGVPGQRTVVIDNGTFVHPIGDTMFFEYLRAQGGIPAHLRPTGPRGTIIINPHGRLHDAQDLLATSGKPVLVVYQWASFAPENNSGNMSVQVRYGMVIEPDGTRYPVINGIVSGNYFEMAKRMFASRERAAAGAYDGPSHVRFENLSVASA
ncbi:MAG TPA: metallopeptidase TldD-related protein, partial [archaeon]|nr:metallopeptidase TldD-related protein [archaeon]